MTENDKKQLLDFCQNNDWMKTSLADVLLHSWVEVSSKPPSLKVEILSKFHQPQQTNASCSAAAALMTINALLNDKKERINEEDLRKLAAGVTCPGSDPTNSSG